MYNEDIEQTKNKSPRRKFVFEIGAISLFTTVGAALGFSFLNRKNDVALCVTPPQKKIITMLTQDGRLVQVDEALITSNREKVSDEELQTWIKK